MQRLNPVAAGLAMGIVWGLCMPFMGLTSHFWNWGTKFVELMGSVYIGYTNTIAGSFIGLAWGAVDGFIGAFLLAWIYNLFLGKCSKD